MHGGLCMHAHVTALLLVQHLNWLSSAHQRMARSACRLAACRLATAAASRAAAAAAAASWPHVDGTAASPKGLPRAPMAMLLDAAA